MNDLFAQADRGLEQLPLPDADVRFQRDLYPAAHCNALLRELIDTTDWRHEQITLFGRQHWQPRLVAVHGDAGLAYTYSGLTLPMQPWTPLLAQLKQDIEQLAGVRFNSVLLNWYRDAQDSMGWHSDDEASLGPAPVIASFSLGATRVFKLKHKTRPELKTTQLALTDGSLLLMAGATQRCWKHAVDKSRTACSARVNLTFRRIMPAS
ncbi:Alkylated DNA repair protein [Oxalobacteraceae bacterium IMCC9480]|nr:Alkylated DNA repair protein [Oxalobacteraceae bacterium IMCC9480]NDP58379.1 alpha-ketoglutarate-dependent dioxygenase AlkB [Oxalobacteraceae bacterium]